MIDRGMRDRVVRVRNLQEYFHTSITDVAARQHVEIDPHAAHYVVNLLTIFSRSNELYEEHAEQYGLRPLALMLAEAANTDRIDHRNHLLQRIGDVALFISGFFADGLAGKAVDVDYYIYMGGNAYDSLSEEIRGTFRGKAFAPVYRELAAKFQVLVDVLNEISDEARRSSDVDLLRTYEIWLKTGSRRAEALLRQCGVEPVNGPADQRH
ncbi:hypothetical protein [Elongatibacter sediminis]|uniref:Uncharacterized protein n=1 Tax=Elongatibacter sediminis TaxID=3119006 RepID=A0AAW9R6L9_9GAMM